MQFEKILQSFQFQYSYPTLQTSS